MTPQHHDHPRGEDASDTGPLDEAAAYGELSRVALADRPLPETLDRIAGLARRTLPELPEVSVTLVEGESAHTAAFTGEPARRLDERQYDQGFGPCLTAALSGRTIKLSVAEPDNAYRDFLELAGEAGVTHTMSLGLPVTPSTAGALNVYGSSGQEFSPEAERIAGTFASFAGIVLGSVGVDGAATEVAAQLRGALRSRAVVEQAKEVVMAERRCSSEEAFEVLTSLARLQQRKLFEVARDLVHARSAG